MEWVCVGVCARGNYNNRARAGIADRVTPTHGAISMVCVCVCWRTLFGVIRGQFVVQLVGQRLVRSIEGLPLTLSPVYMLCRIEIDMEIIDLLWCHAD